MKKLNTALFKIGRGVIRASRVAVDSEAHFLRLPVGIKIATRKLRIDDQAIPSFTQILEDPYLPLSELHLNLNTGYFEEFEFWDRHVLREELVANAEKLIIRDVCLGLNSWEPLLTSLSNRYIQLDLSRGNSIIPDFSAIVQNVIENGRPIGTCYFLCVCREENQAYEFITKMRRRWPQVVPGDYRHAAIQMRNGSILQIAYFPFSDEAIRIADADTYPYFYPYGIYGHLGLRVVANPTAR